MKKILLEIVGLVNSQTHPGAFTLILSDEEKGRRLPILIGYSEAQSIAMFLDKVNPQRPLTHDLFKNFAIQFGIQFTEVIIYSLKEGVFHAKLICTDGVMTKEIDARTSDAVAMAIRFDCPVYTYESILSQAGLTADDKGDPESEISDESKTSIDLVKEKGKYSELKKKTAEELRIMLESALKDEAYEYASFIRDEIQKRNKPKK